MAKWIYSVCFIWGVLLTTDTAGAFYLSQTPETEPFHSNTSQCLEARMGILKGQAMEIVYDPLTGRKISELQWDMDEVYMAGLSLTGNITPQLSVNAVFMGNAISDGNGKMNNFDWLKQERPYEWSNWSQSRITLERGIIMDMNLKATLASHGSMDVYFTGGFKYDRWQWEDRSGWFVYSSASGWRNNKGTYSGTKIRYEQRYYCPYLGFEAAIRKGSFLVNGYIKGTVLAWADGEDNHLDRGVIFEDQFEEMKFLGVGVKARYDFSQNGFASLSLDYQKFYHQYGDTNVILSSGNLSQRYKNGAGIEQQSFCLSIGIGFMF